MIKTILGLCAASILLISCAHTNENGMRTPSQAAPTLMDASTEYRVMFTDPLCGRYEYTGAMKSSNGTDLKSKPKNVFCKSMYDIKTSGERDSSPQRQLELWTLDPNTKHIVFTYLSFRNKKIKETLCKRLKAKEIRVTFVMSSSEDTAAADFLKSSECGDGKNVEYKTRGLEGELGYAHNKIYMVLNKVVDIRKKDVNGRLDWRSQFGAGDAIKIAFSSGNMTSGPVMHHENWHFITTNAGKHFSQMHLCVLQSEWDDGTGKERNAYMGAIAKCRKDLKTAGNLEESDIKVFFVPGEGENQFDNPQALDNGEEGKSAAEYMLNGDGKDYPGIRSAGKIWIGAHRFFYSKMIRALQKRMEASKSQRPEIRITVDDDTYYKAVTPDEFQLGDTAPEEWFNIEGLVSQGAQVRLMETNSEEHQLHHSKYLLFFKGSEPKSLLCGAANLTGAGFKKNWENIYFIKIPQVVNAFRDHYVKFWMPDGATPGTSGFKDNASTVNMMPTTGVVIDKLTEEGKKE